MPSASRSSVASPVSAHSGRDGSGQSERERVLLKKFGGDLPLPPSGRKSAGHASNELSSIGGDSSWPGVVIGGGGPRPGEEDGSFNPGGVGLAHRSGDPSDGHQQAGSGSSKKKENVDAGIAPWLAADASDYRVSTRLLCIRGPRRGGARRRARELEPDARFDSLQA
jgi:hypothetical protein